MTKCHECGSRFTVIAIARRKDTPSRLYTSFPHDTLHLCRTCAYGRGLRMNRILNGRQQLIIPFVKRRIWLLGNHLV